MTTRSELEDALIAAQRKEYNRLLIEYGEEDAEQYEIDDEYPDVNWDAVQGLFEDWGTYGYDNPIQENGLTIILEDSYGGEGLGEEYWIVLKVVNGDDTQYFKVEGWYSSFGSEGPFSSVYSEDDRVYEVGQVEVVKTEWRKK